MDIAFVSNVVYPYVTGGAQKRIYEIGTRLVDRGHDVTVYARHYWDGEETMTHEGMTLHAVAPPHDLYVDQGGRRSITEALEFATRITLPLARRADSHDIIIASVFPYFPVFTGALAAQVQNTPFVTTWHEVWLDYWEEYLGGFAIGGKVVERLTAQVPQNPVAVSEVTANRLTRIGVNREAIEILPNGIDIDWINSISAVPDGAEILFVGRLIPDKNVDILLTAFGRIATDYDVSLSIIGEGPQEDQLQKQANNMAAQERVNFHGFLTDYEDVIAHMQAADIFISPSTREGFGITFLEAMASGCTVIAADHPESAAREVLGDAGMLVEPTAPAVADAIKCALEDPIPAETTHIRAAEFDWDQIVNEAESFYQSLCKIN